MPTVQSVVVKSIRPWREAKREFEVAYINKVLAQTQGNMSEAALLADKDRKDFYVMVQRNDIDYTKFRS